VFVVSSERVDRGGDVCREVLGVVVLMVSIGFAGRGGPEVVVVFIVFFVWRVHHGSDSSQPVFGLNNLLV
jgi:hypothetical protein